jgi:hypothetical protein
MMVVSDYRFKSLSAVLARSQYRHVFKTMLRSATGCLGINVCRTIGPFCMQLKLHRKTTHPLQLCSIWQVSCASILPPCHTSSTHSALPLNSRYPAQ